MPKPRRRLGDGSRYVIDADFTFCDLFQSRKHAERRGFSTTRRAEQDKEFTVIDL